jgi:hypothetical protein
MLYYTFETEVACADGHCYVTVPQAVRAHFPAGEHLPVCGALNGYPYRGDVLRTGRGWRMTLQPVWLEGAHLQPGQRVELTMGYDDEPREAVIPWELTQSLGQHNLTDDKWAQLPEDQRMAFCLWVDAADGRDRDKRAEKAAHLVLHGRQLELESGA